MTREQYKIIHITATNFHDRLGYIIKLQYLFCDVERFTNYNKLINNSHFTSRLHDINLTYFLDDVVLSTNMIVVLCSQFKSFPVHNSAVSASGEGFIHCPDRRNCSLRNINRARLKLPLRFMTQTRKTYPLSAPHFPANILREHYNF